MNDAEDRCVAVGNVVVVATPDPKFRRFVREQLQFRSVEIEFVSGGAEALSRVETGLCGALVLDIGLLDLDVDEVKDIVADRYPGVGVWIARFNSDGLHMEDVHGTPSLPEAFLPLQSSVEIAGPGDAARRALDGGGLAEIDERFEEACLPGMVGRSAAVRRVQRLVRLVAARKTAVLLSGETGTGKELVAKAIHQLGPRSGRPFVVVNCSAIPETLFESELFGYQRGAFTGAVESRLGRIHAAHKGTLFLDEVGELPLAMQSKLLRFLQEGEVQRLGSQETLHVDARVIAATNADLWKLVSAERFREDLFYRLAVFPVALEPLRERPGDVELLVEHFLEELSAEAGTPRKILSAGALRLLLVHTWPGNVRELKHCLERAFILAEEATLLLPEHVLLRAPERHSQKNLMDWR